jgi:PKD repeat protein
VTNLALYTDHGQLITWIAPPSNPFTWAFSLAIGDGTRCYYARAVQADGDHSLTAPVWTERPVASLQANNDGPTVLGQPTTLTATIAAGSSVTYTWAPGDGTRSSGSVLVHTYPAPGVYTAVVTASNSISLLTATTAVQVDQAVVGLAATNDSPTALGGPTYLTATTTAGSRVLYTWGLGDGTRGSGSTLMHIYTAPGVYTAIVTASNSVSLLTTTTAVTVEEVIAGLAAMNDGPSALGQPTMVAAAITAGSSVTYTWDLGDGTRGSGSTLVHIYTAPGVYTAAVTASNSISLLTAATVVQVDEAIAGLTAVNDGPSVLGRSTVFTATVISGTRVAYTWAFGDGSPGEVGPIVSHTYAASGVYTAVVTARNPVGSIWTTTRVVIESPVRFAVYIPLVVRGAPLRRPCPANRSLSY